MDLSEYLARKSQIFEEEYKIIVEDKTLVSNISKIQIIL